MHALVFVTGLFFVNHSNDYTFRIWLGELNKCFVVIIIFSCQQRSMEWTPFISSFIQENPNKTWTGPCWPRNKKRQDDRGRQWETSLRSWLRRENNSKRSSNTFDLDEMFGPHTAGTRDRGRGLGPGWRARSGWVGWDARAAWPHCTSLTRVI